VKLQLARCNLSQSTLIGRADLVPCSTRCEVLTCMTKLASSDSLFETLTCMTELVRMPIYITELASRCPGIEAAARAKINCHN